MVILPKCIKKRCTAEKIVKDFGYLLAMLFKF